MNEQERLEHFKMRIREIKKLIDKGYSLAEAKKQIDRDIPYPKGYVKEPN